MSTDEERASAAGLKPQEPAEKAIPKPAEAPKSDVPADEPGDAETKEIEQERSSTEPEEEAVTTTKAEGEEEEEETCGFCKFMKGGACKAVFVEWEKCVDKARDAGEDFVDTCLDTTKALKECLEAHPDYYSPVLDPPEGDGEGSEDPEVSEAEDPEDEPGGKQEGEPSSHRAVHSAVVEQSQSKPEVDKLAS